jgi:hypothetical protein
LCGSCQRNFGQTDPFTCSPCLGIEGHGGGDIEKKSIFGLMVVYLVVFVVVVWFTAAMIMLDSEVQRPAAAMIMLDSEVHHPAAAMIMLDSEVHHPAAAKPPPAAAAAAAERSPSAAGAGDGVDDDEQHLLITDVVKAFIMYAQVSGDGHDTNSVTILV